MRDSICSKNSTHPGIVNATEFMELLPGDHDGCQVGGVDGEEHDGEHGPHVGHEPANVGGVRQRRSGFWICRG